MLDASRPVCTKRPGRHEHAHEFTAPGSAMSADQSKVARAPALGELQRQFKTYLLTGEDALRDSIADAGAAQVETRMDVYFQAYRLRLAEALQADYGTVYAYLGDARFTALARDYFDAFPSRHPSIRWCGAHLAEFINTVPRWAEVPALADIAALDWAISTSFDAADAMVIDESAMAQVPPEAWAGISFQFHPSVRTLDLTWNAAEMRGYADAGEALPEPARGEFPVRFVVWRQALEAMYRSSDVDEAFSLTHAMQGMAFGDLCEGVCEWIAPEHAAMHAAGMLKRWINDEMVSAIRLP